LQSLNINSYSRDLYLRFGRISEKFDRDFIVSHCYCKSVKFRINGIIYRRFTKVRIIKEIQERRKLKLPVGVSLVSLISTDIICKTIERPRAAHRSRGAFRRTRYSDSRASRHAQIKNSSACRDCLSEQGGSRADLFIIDVDRFTRTFRKRTRQFALRSFVCSLKCSRAIFLQRYVL